MSKNCENCSLVEFCEKEADILQDDLEFVNEWLDEYFLKKDWADDAKARYYDQHYEGKINDKALASGLSVVNKEYERFMASIDVAQLIEKRRTLTGDLFQAEEIEYNVHAECPGIDESSRTVQELGSAAMCHSDSLDAVMTEVRMEHFLANS